MKTSRFTNQPKVVVCGVISPVRGNVYYHYGIRSFNAQDVIEVLKAVRADAGPKAKLALFWDNARIHRAHIVRDAAATPEINIEFVWNIAYRPDLNGIELVWRRAKWLYKAKVDWLKAQNRS